MFSEGGVRLHPETLRRLAAPHGRHAPVWPLWLAVAALAAVLALALAGAV
jgi:hypothetical protein